MTWRETASSIRDEVAVSRALNVDAGEAEVRKECDKRSLPISAIETLVSGGTRVVMVRLDDAIKLRRVFKTKLVEGTAARVAWASR